MEKNLDIIIKFYFKVLFQYVTAGNKETDNNHKTLNITPQHLAASFGISQSVTPS